MRKITLTKEIYELYRELERLEDKLYFSVSYPLSRAFDSHHFLPGFYVEDRYYEIHNNDDNELKVLSFNPNARLGDEGYEISDEYLKQLVETLKKL